MGIDFRNPVIQPIRLAGRKVDVLRLDVIHPVVSGNKWYKLKAYIEYIKAHGLEGFVTFGGAYSNHLHAAAVAAKSFGLKAVAVIRGREFETLLNETLYACREAGMELLFVERAVYDTKEEQNFLAGIQKMYPGYYIIPEGGSGPLGRAGMEELCRYIDPHYTHILLSAGSGTTLHGIRDILPENQQVLGLAPMKKGAYLNGVIRCSKANWKIIDDYHFGGFGKYTPDLIAYMNRLFEEEGLPTDRVYTAKMFAGIEDLIRKEYFNNSDRLLALHTGGLQGNNTLKGQLKF